MKTRIDTSCPWSRPARGPASRLLRRKLNVGCFCWSGWVTTETAQTCKQNRWCRYRLESFFFFFPCVPPVPATSGNINKYPGGEQRAQCCSGLKLGQICSCRAQTIAGGSLQDVSSRSLLELANNFGPAVITLRSHNQVLISTNLCSLCGERLQHSWELLARVVRRCYWPAWLRINNPLFNSTVLCARGKF